MATKNSVRKQRHRSAAEWRRLVAAWKASDKTRRDWCKEQGLSTESLRRWTKRLRGTESKVSLVEIDHEGNHGAAIGQTFIRITRDGDVELSGSIEEGILRSVLRVMRETARVS
jgi:hypothetical protein